ncbi:MAG: BCCT family transporter [Cyclobacteriaceae bacterium]
MIIALVFSLVDGATFLSFTKQANDFVLNRFGRLFSGGTLLMFLTCVILYFHPISKQKIGGEDAVPLLNKWQWFSIVLCTTIATGIIFWGTAEPIYHILSPPAFSGLSPQTAQAGSFAMSIMYLHWSLIPYAIYTVPAVVFAIAFYNHKLPFSLSSTLFPISNKLSGNVLSNAIDSICLYALVAGMAASLGAGILTLSGGFNYLFNWNPKWILLLLTIGIVCCFVISAVSGLMKGIRLLSDLNVKIFFGLTVFVFLTSDIEAIMTLSLEGIWAFAKNFFEYTSLSILYPSDPWPKSWTTFYWANWLAWAPITAMFLGRLSYGYSIKQFLIFNWIIPSLFGIIWMSVFSGTAIDLFLNKGIDLGEVLNTDGPEAVIYTIFNTLPLSKIVAIIFLFTAFLSYVTAADSNTEAMSGISSTGISPKSPSPPISIKVIWGIVIATIAFVMVNMAGVDGVKMLSNLGGLPALILILAINFGLLKMMFSRRKE